MALRLKALLVVAGSFFLGSCLQGARSNPDSALNRFLHHQSVRDIWTFVSQPVKTSFFDGFLEYIVTNKESGVRYRYLVDRAFNLLRGSDSYLPSPVAAKTLDVQRFNALSLSRVPQDDADLRLYAGEIERLVFGGYLFESPSALLALVQDSGVHASASPQTTAPTAIYSGLSGLSLKAVNSAGNPIDLGQPTLTLPSITSIAGSTRVVYVSFVLGDAVLFYKTDLTVRGDGKIVSYISAFYGIVPPAEIASVLK